MLRRHRAAVVWLLVAAMTLSPSIVSSQPPRAGQPAKTGGKGNPTLGLITPETVAAVVAYPRRVLTAPEMELMPVEVLSAAAKKEVGIDPLEVEQVLVIVEPPRAGPPQVAVVLRMVKPVGEGKVLALLWDRTVESQIEGKTYRRAKNVMNASIFPLDDRTLVVGHDDLLRRMLAQRAHPQAGKMKQVLGAATEKPDLFAVVLVESLRPILSAVLAQAPIPPPFAGVRAMPDLVSSVEAKANLTGNMDTSLTLRAKDETAAKQLAELIDGALANAQQAMLGDVAKRAASSDPVEQALAKYVCRVSPRMLQTLRPVRQGDVLTLRTQGTTNAQLASVSTIGILAGLLLPAVQASREAARRAQSANNMKLIALAMHNSLNANYTFPPRAKFGKDGKPLLSWRVHLLPYLDQKALWEQFHLDESWDSPHNRKLVALMPALFVNPSRPPRQQTGRTPYLAVCGEGLMFQGTEGRKIPEIRDGLSNTIMVVEADSDRAVIWTQPDDWEYDAKHPLAGLGQAHPGGFNAAFADGSVRFISRNIDPNAFHALLTIAGGEKHGP